MADCNEIGHRHPKSAINISNLTNTFRLQLPLPTVPIRLFHINEYGIRVVFLNLESFTEHSE